MNSGENGCRKMHNFALSLTVMGSLKIFLPPLPLPSPLFFLGGRELFCPLETHAECSPLFSCSRTQAPRRGRRAALRSSYILHHSQPRAERRVRGPGGLGAEFSRDPGPEERERVTGQGLGVGDLCVSLPGACLCTGLIWGCFSKGCPEPFPLCACYSGF